MSINNTWERVRHECWWRECVDVEGCWGESLLLPLLLSRCGVVLLLLFLSWHGPRRRAARWAVNPCDSWFDYLRPQSSFSLLTTKAYAPLTSSPLSPTYLPPLNQLERFNMALLFSGRWPVLAVSRTKALASRLDVITDCSMWATVQYSTLLYYFKVLLCSLTIKHQCLMAAFIMVLLLDTAVKTLWTTSTSVSLLCVTDIDMSLVVFVCIFFCVACLSFLSAWTMNLMWRDISLSL